MRPSDPAPPPELIRQTVEDVARTSYGRLVAYLASVGGDLVAAEDALSEAFLAALRTWPERGVPARPDAWLVTAARRSLIDVSRRRQVAARALPDLARLVDQSEGTERSLGMAASPAIPDKRLELLFACTHPALDPAMRSPLMLQTVLGLDAVRIGAAFLVAPATMGQRLVRIKAKIKDAGVPFAVPGAEALPERLSSVLDAVYAAYGTGWDEQHVDRGKGLVREALRLAGLVVELLPGEPEAHGLLALLHHSHARAGARRDGDGDFIPLDRQDVHRWSAPDIASAEEHLALALPAGRIGPYQLHAAIQSVHNRRAVSGRTDWVAIAALYDGLVALTPTVGGYVARAAAHGRASGPQVGLDLLDELPADRVLRYQPYWVARAHCLQGVGRGAGAAEAAGIALQLTEDPAVRRFLRGEYPAAVEQDRG